MKKRLSLSDALGQGMADRRIDILRQIGIGGSISQAARAVGVSYKAAWQAVDALTNLAGVPLVARAVGGTGGGGAQLTPAGHELLHAADALEQARRDVLARLSPQAGAASGGGPGGSAALARLALRTSLRNQWPCTVQSLEPLGPLMRVHLQGESAPQLALCARITQESVELLALRPGLPVLALCKAAAVRVQAGLPAALASNLWPGRASRVSRGPAGDEVSAMLDAGVHMVGFAAPSSGLRSGRRVAMAVDESAVVLAVTG